MPSENIVNRFIARVESGSTIEAIEELAYQHWQDEKIASEQFFYDPAQLR